MCQPVYILRRRSVQVLARPQVAADVYGAASRKYKDVRGNNFPLAGKKPVGNLFSVVLEQKYEHPD
jgi:hypothetical protein